MWCPIHNRQYNTSTCPDCKPTPRRAPGTDRIVDDVNHSTIKPADGGGMRHNAGKNMIELIPIEWTWGLGLVLTRGAVKYAVRNWERGMKWSYLIGCISRHVLKFMAGERYDKETGCHHMFLAAWNCCALASYDIRQIGENDMGAGKLEWLEACAVAPGPELQARMNAKSNPEIVVIAGGGGGQQRPV